MADRTYEELREQGCDVVAALLTATRMTNEGDGGDLVDPTSDLLSDLLGDYLLTIYVIGVLVGLASTTMHAKCLLEHEGDWSAAMADLRRGVI